VTLEALRALFPKNYPIWEPSRYLLCGRIRSVVESAVWLIGFSLYGVATISRLFEMIGLFCKRALLKRRNSAKETYDFKGPTHRSHPISIREPLHDLHETVFKDYVIREP